MQNKLRKLIPLVFLAAIALAVIVPSAVVFAPQPVLAQTASGSGAATTTQAPTASTNTTEGSWLGNIVVQGVSAIVQVLIELFGKLAIQLIHILILVAGYNSYMTAPAVTAGWVIVRDVANLFFVAMILVVSIGSIVNPDRFGGARQVFRILLFALLVNFSRTIAGIFIDISQLVMLTFVNGFAQAAGGNFVEALGITKLTSFPQTGGAIGVGATVASIFMALIMFVIIVVVIGVMTVALVVRMVTLWMLVVMSPIAFALGASDMTKKHYSEWWSKFSNELTVGPIVAFFLWLSLITFQSSAGSNITGQPLQAPSAGKEQVDVSCGAAIACAEDNMIRFTVAICMLLMGLGFAKEFSGVGGAVAGAATRKLKGYAKGAINYGAKKSWGATKTVAGATVNATGIPLAVNKVGDVYTSLKQRAASGLGNSALGRAPIVGRLTRSIAGGMLSSTAARDEKQLDEAKKRMQNYTPEMRVAVLRGKLSSTDAERKAVAMSMLKDKSHKNANKGALAALDRATATPEKIAEAEAEVKRAEAFEEATKLLGGATPGRNKDVDDLLKDIGDARPDLKAQVTGGKKTFKPDDFAASATREELKKVNWDAIPETIRDQIFSALSRKGDTFNDFYKKTSAKTKEYMDHAVMKPGISGAELEGVLSAATVDLSKAKVGDNVEVIRQMMKSVPSQSRPLEAIHQQFRDLRANTDATAMRSKLADSVKGRLNFATGAGIDPNHGRIQDDVLRDVEGAVVLGRGAGEFYGFTEDGHFGSGDDRGSVSLHESLANSPQRLEFALSLADAGSVRGDVGEIVSNTITNKDLVVAAQMAKEPGEIDRVKKLAQAIYDNSVKNKARGDNRHAQMMADPELRSLFRMLSKKGDKKKPNQPNQQAAGADDEDDEA